MPISRSSFLHLCIILCSLFAIQYIYTFLEIFSFPFTFYFIIFVCLRFASISIVAITQRVRDAIFLRVSPYLGSMLATIIEITKVTNDRGDIYIYIYIENLSVSIYTLCRNYVEVEGKLRPIKGRWHAWTKKAWLVKSFHVAACLGALSLSLVVASTRGTSMTSFIGISAPRPERHVADVPLLISRESGRRRNLIIGR